MIGQADIVRLGGRARRQRLALVGGQAGSRLRHFVWRTALTIGVLVGTSLALPAGFLLGRMAMLRLACEPLLNLFRALPPIALIPLVIVYFGIGESAKLIVLSLAAFFAAVIMLRLALGVTWATPVAAELVATQRGLGA